MARGDGIHRTSARNARMKDTDIGTTIGGYSGPGTIGIVFARKEK